MDFWTQVETRKVGQFDIVLDWTYEHASISDCFDDTVSDVEDMVRRHNAGIDTHYIARVRAMYDGVEMGCSTLGSCYAYDCSPEDDMLSGISGYLDDMIDEAVDQAQDEAVRMLERLKTDFLGVAA